MISKSEKHIHPAYCNQHTWKSYKYEISELKANLTNEFDAKILKNILANRTEKNIKIVRHHDQMVFISAI